MNVQTLQSGQGLLSVRIDGKASDWKIANRLGVWNLYKAHTGIKLDRDLARVIHKPDQLNKIISDFISAISA